MPQALAMTVKTIQWMTVVLACSASFVFAETPTFSRDVATIMHEKCTVCHRPDSSGPFHLITYNDAKRRAATIEAVLEDNYMPPWKPVDHRISFANARNLSKQEKRTITAWINAGCPEGDRTQTPAAPEFADGWSLGKPDLVVKMNGAFEVPAEGPDIYRSFVFPLGLPEDKWVKAVELRPRAKNSVHHAIFYLDSNGNARKLDGADGQTGIFGMGFLADVGGGNGNQAGPATGKQGQGPWRLLNRLRGAIREASPEEGAYRQSQSLNRGLGGYVPGATPNRLPGDLAMALPKGSDIVMQTHFHPSGKPETEQAELALYFADRPPTKRLVPVMVPPMFGIAEKLRIPAGEKNYVMTDSFTLPVDTQAIGVNGHAHYICRDMKLTARTPSDKTLVLLHIDDWDLDWQDQYLFEKPIDLPAGTVLHAEITYDNSAENPENPFHPPQDIRWGRGSNDEMGSVTLITVAKNRGEGSALQSAVRQHLMSTFVHADFVSILMQFDDDHDGKLQPTEAPPRLGERAFEFLDQNGDKALDQTELSRMLKFRDLLRTRAE